MGLTTDQLKAAGLMILVGFIFAFAVYKIDSTNIDKTTALAKKTDAAFRAAIAAANAGCAGSARDIDAFNAASNASKNIALLQARITEGNANLIQSSIDSGAISGKLVSYYSKLVVVNRQRAAEFRSEAKKFKQLPRVVCGRS